MALLITLGVVSVLGLVAFGLGYLINLIPREWTWLDLWKHLTRRLDR